MKIYHISAMSKGINPISYYQFGLCTIDIRLTGGDAGCMAAILILGLGPLLPPTLPPPPCLLLLPTAA